MKYKYSVEMTPEEAGTLMREISANVPVFVENALRLMSMLTQHLQGGHGPEGGEEESDDNVLRVVWPKPGEPLPEEGASDPEDASRGPQKPRVAPSKMTFPERLAQYGLTPETGLMRTLEVLQDSGGGIVIAERGLADRPASYEGDGFAVALNWPSTRELENANNVWVRFLSEWCQNYEVPAADPTAEAERRPAMLAGIAGTPAELPLKKHIVFAAGGCLNRAVYRTLLLRGLLTDGKEHTRFSEASRADAVRLADHISANITLVAHGIMPELRIFHDITGKWTLHTLARLGPLSEDLGEET